MVGTNKDHQGCLLHTPIQESRRREDCSCHLLPLSSSLTELYPNKRRKDQKFPQHLQQASLGINKCKL